jgi:hypothetical protein
VVPSYQVVRQVIPRIRIDDALRLIHRDMMERGIDAAELGDWLWGMHWFPHLRFRDEIVALSQALPAEWREGRPCEPQILLQFPHVGAEEPEISFHVDREPDWAQGQPYLRIVGVPLSSWSSENGGLIVQTDSGPTALRLEPGDAVCMAPDLPHSGGVNRTGAIRYGVYFRFVPARQGER